MHEGLHALDDTISRLRSFTNVGADCLYAPGPTDEKLTQRIVAEAGGLVNALFRMGSGLTFANAAEWGIRRVSVGSSLYEATMAVFSSMVTQLTTTGSFEIDFLPLDYENIELLCR